VSRIRLLFISWLAFGFLVAACGADDRAADDAIPLDPAAAAAARRGDTATTATLSDSAAEEEVDLLDATQIRGDPVNQYDLALGDCFNRLEALRAGRKVVITTLIDCEDPHQYEVFHTLQYDAPHPAIYPGEDVLTDFGLNQCYLEFESFVGEIYELSEFDIGVFIPTRENFEHSVARYRGIHCWLFRDDLEEIEGSARGTAL
jgi:hypothetical protein